MIVALIIALALAGCIGIWIVLKSEKVAIRTRFIGRSPISVDEFIDMLDLDVEQDCLNNALKELSVIFSVEKELIRPTDRFDTEFAPVKGSETDSPIGTLEFEIVSEAKAKGMDIESLDIRTVRDFIAFKCRKTP
jgi:hypothetical protein